MTKGFTIAAGPKATWHYVKADDSWMSFDEDEVREMRQAMDVEIAQCGYVGGRCVIPGEFAPSHFSGSARLPEHNGEIGKFGGPIRVTEPRAYTYQCHSGSRWFNPKTRKLEGRAHCTCDGCF